MDNEMRKNKLRLFIKFIFIILMVRRYVYIWGYKNSIRDIYKDVFEELLFI